MTIEKTWCIYSHLTKDEKKKVNEIVYNCLKRNGFEPEDPWWEMNYRLPSEDLEPSDNEMMSSFGTKWHDGL